MDLAIVFDLDWLQILQFVIAVVLPLLVGLVTTRVTHASAQSILLLALSFATSLAVGLVDASQAGQVYDLGQALISGLTTFIIGVAMHYGVWKPTGATAKALNSGRKAHV